MPETVRPIQKKKTRHIEQKKKNVLRPLIIESQFSHVSSSVQQTWFHSPLHPTTFLLLFFNRINPRLIVRFPWWQYREKRAETICLQNFQFCSAFPPSKTFKVFKNHLIKCSSKCWCRRNGAMVEPCLTMINLSWSRFWLDGGNRRLCYIGGI